MIEEGMGGGSIQRAGPKGGGGTYGLWPRIKVDRKERY